MSLATGVRVPVLPARQQTRYQRFFTNRGVTGSVDSFAVRDEGIPVQLVSAAIHTVGYLLLLHSRSRRRGCIVGPLADTLLHFFEPGSGIRTINHSSQEFQPLGDIVPIAPDVIFFWLFILRLWPFASGSLFSTACVIKSRRLCSALCLMHGESNTGCNYPEEM